MNRIKNELYKKWTYKKIMYKKWTYKKWNYKKWTYKKWTNKEWTYKKRTDPFFYPAASYPVVRSFDSSLLVNYLCRIGFDRDTA